MILSEFAKYVQNYDQELMRNEILPIELLQGWLLTIINKNPKNNIEKVVHREIMYAQNSNGDYLIVGKSESGRKLVTALINFAQSYENYNRAKWLEQAERAYKSSDN